MDLARALDAASSAADFQTEHEHTEVVRAARRFLARVETPSDLIDNLDTASKDDFRTETERLEAVRAARGFLDRVETPFERAYEMAVGQPALVASLKIALDVNLFREWAMAGGHPRTYEDLAGLVNRRPEALRRVLRHLAAENVLQEIRRETYARTAFSRALEDDSTSCWVRYYGDMTGPVFAALPAYLRGRAYAAPSQPRDGVYQSAFQCVGQSFAARLRARPAQFATFQSCWRSYAHNFAAWTDVYPIERLFHGWSSEQGRYLIVAVSDSRVGGQPLELVCREHPEVAGHLVLQGSQADLARATCDAAIHRMPHDLTHPQPVDGARFYLLHFILNYANDRKARIILGHLHAVMESKYSRLLIVEELLPDDQPERRLTSTDMLRMMDYTSHLRYADMFTELLESEGFEVVNIFRGSNEQRTTVIEAHVPA